MSKLKKTTITIYNCIGSEEADICLNYVDGTQKNKKVNLFGLFEKIKSLNPESEDYAILGRMPYGYVTGKYKDNRNFSVILSIPGAQMPVQFMGKLFSSVPFPELIFAFKYCGGNLNRSLVYATNSSGELCRYPFGNVYDDGRICWGSYVHSEVTCISDAELAARKFYELPTNNDLWEKKYVRHDVGILSNMYSMLDGMACFPDEWLVCLPGMTMDDILNKI